METGLDRPNHVDPLQQFTFRARDGRSGARLMLAIAERLILDEGLEWAFCDTDSMAIAKPLSMPDAEFYETIDRIVARFGSLNPYNFAGSILKIEEVNYSLENPKIRQPLFVWAVSAKRYVLFNIEDGQPIIRKASAHGLAKLRLRVRGNFAFAVARQFMLLSSTYALTSGDDNLRRPEKRRRRDIHIVAVWRIRGIGFWGLLSSSAKRFPGASAGAR